MPRPRKTTTRKRVVKKRIFKPKMTLRAKENQILCVRKHVASKDLLLGNVGASSTATTQLNNSGLFTLTCPAAQAIYYFTVGLGFCLRDVPDVSGYQLLYDRFRFRKVEVKLFPVNTVSATAVNIIGAPGTGETYGNGSIGGFLHHCIDYDDNVVPVASDVGIDTIRNRKSYKMVNIATNKPITMTLRPRIAVGAYESAAVFQGYANMPAMWCDTVAPSDVIEHYGWKGIFELVNPNSNVNYVNFKLEVTYHLEFCDPK